MGQRGSAAVEVALLTPVLGLVVLGLVQFALWYHAEQVVVAAAQEAAARASAESGNPRAAEERAHALLRGIRGMTGEPEVAIEPAAADRVAVVVRAAMRPILPGIGALGLRARAVAHVERLSP